jgi:phosphopantetheinyl transferase
MEDVSQIIDKIRLPVEIKIYPYLMDYKYERNAVLPVVEAMQLLAASTQTYLPSIDIKFIFNAKFDKSLYIQLNDGLPYNRTIEAFNEIEVYGNGNTSSRLITKNRSKKASISPIKEHVSIHFTNKKHYLQELPLDFVSALEGICLDIPSYKLYNNLVSFGPAYHNVKDVLFISEKGAIVNIDAAANRDASSDPLGSPFPLDASFHAACAWGQRFLRFVGSPVGFEKRFMFNKIHSEDTYISRVMPVQINSDQLVFDIWIYDLNGTPYEAILGVRIRDVRAGPMKPPQWVTGKVKDNGLKCIKNHCKAFSVIELKTLNRVAEKALSDHELNRFNEMGNKRGRSYLAARLCCKSISRHLSGDDWGTSARSITTISPDQIRPQCPLTDGRVTFSCSVSHDSRFAIAVASKNKVGVDVEEISGKALSSQCLYMSERERALVENSSLGEMRASIRIWTIKEAVSKALDLNLADSWKRVLVTDIGLNRSSIIIDDKVHAAFHDTVDNHLFTVINIE